MNLTELTLDQIKQALRNSGYIDGDAEGRSDSTSTGSDILDACFVRVRPDGVAVYAVSYLDDAAEMTTSNLYVSCDADGILQGEW